MDLILGMLVDSGSPASGGLAIGLSGTLITLGFFIKNNTPINDDWIPMILLLIAIPGYIIMVWPVDFLGVVMAVGSALSAVGAWELNKRTNVAQKTGHLMTQEPNEK